MNLSRIHKTYFTPITKIMLEINENIDEISIDKEIDIIFSEKENDVEYFYNLLDTKENNLLKLVDNIFKNIIYSDNLYTLLEIDKLINKNSVIYENINDMASIIKFDITCWLFGFLIQLNIINRKIIFVRLITLLLKYTEPEKVNMLKNLLSSSYYSLAEILETKYTKQDIEKLINEGPPKFMEISYENI